MIFYFMGYPFYLHLSLQLCLNAQSLLHYTGMVLLCYSKMISYQSVRPPAWKYKEKGLWSFGLKSVPAGSIPSSRRKSYKCLLEQEEEQSLGTLVTDSSAEFKAPCPRRHRRYHCCWQLGWTQEPQRETLGKLWQLSYLKHPKPCTPIDTRCWSWL